MLVLMGGGETCGLHIALYGSFEFDADAADSDWRDVRHESSHF
jgi:hypothetical protein